MSYPDIVRAELDEAIRRALKNSTFAATEKPLRSRKLTREDTIRFILSMEGGSLQKELYKAGLDVSVSAFVQRRKLLPAALFVDILQEFNNLHPDRNTYRGYRILGIDGTSVNISRNPSSPCFVCNASAPEGYGQVHATPLFDLLNKTYVDCVLQPQPRQDEVGALLYFISWHDFEEKTLIIGDRNFSSYNIFAHIQNTPNCDFLIRTKTGRGAMREVEKLPLRELDTEIRFVINTSQTKEAKDAGHIILQVRKKKDRKYSSKTRAGRWDFPSPYPMKLRIVRILLDSGEYETLATSLPPSFTTDEIRELYRQRWAIETSFMFIKYHIGLSHLHTKTDEFSYQEIYASMIMMNFCSRIVNEVIIRQKEENVYQYQVNMKMAVYLCKRFLRTPGADGEQLMRDIARYTEPVRPGRRDARKITPKSFVSFIYRVAA